MLYRHCCFRICHQEGARKSGNLELNGTHQPLVCGDSVNMLGENMKYCKKNTEALLEAIKEVGRSVRLEVNTEELNI
jgi:hypothetical protein